MADTQETEMSEPAATLTQRAAAADAETDLSDAFSDAVPKPEPAAESQTYVRRTRWSSAIMDGVDPKMRYANKRFSDIYEQPDDAELKKARRTKPSPRETTEAPIFVQQDPACSEDDSESSPSIDIRTIRNILNAIRDVVTALIPKPVLITDLPKDQSKEQKHESVYGTRSASARSQESINADASATAPGGKASETELIGMCDDLKTVQKDVGDLLNRGMYSRNEKIKFVVYSILELVALRADHYYRMIQNMERLARYAHRTESIPTDFVTTLIDMYGAAALQHLEHIRRRMPIKVRHTGVLNFKPWRAVFGGTTLSMDNVNDLLKKYEFKKLKDMAQTRTKNVRALMQEQQSAMLKAIEARNRESMLSASYAKLRQPDAQKKGGITSLVSTAANTQESIGDALMGGETQKAKTEGRAAQKGKSETGRTRAKAGSAQRNDSVSDAQDAGQPKTASSKRAGGRKAATTRGGSNAARPGKSKSLELERTKADDSDGPIMKRKHGSLELVGTGLFTDDDEAAFSEYSDEESKKNDSTKSKGRSRAASFRGENKSPDTTSTSPTQVGARGAPNRIALARRMALNRSGKSVESWRNLKMTSGFEPVKLDGDDTLKIPKVKRDPTPKASPPTEEAASPAETPKAADSAPTTTVGTPERAKQRVVYETNRLKEGPGSASFSPPPNPYRKHVPPNPRRGGPNITGGSPPGHMYPMYMIPPPPPHPNMLMFHNAMYNAMPPHPKAPWAMPPVAAPAPHIMSPKHCHPISPTWRNQGPPPEGLDSPNRGRGFPKRHHQMPRNPNRRPPRGPNSNPASPKSNRVV